MNSEFKKAFAELNNEQKQAVNHINGPLLVIAGPGTGKTQLLALRTANILSQDSTVLPSNILCLTFTDNAADNMRRRLVRYIGQDAYQVSIHTFNAFGQYIMNAFPEFFYEWRQLQTADELTTHRILEDILAGLPGSHILAAHGSDGTFYSLKQLKNFISDAKRNNLQPDELSKVLAQNQAAYAELTPLVQQYWPATMYAKDQPLEKIADFASELAKLKPDKPVIEAVVPEKNLIIESFLRAAAESAERSSGQTKPYTTWKDYWLKKDADNKFVFAGAEQIDKLAAAVDIYDRYQAGLDSRGLADFSDQIMWVLRTLQTKPELRYNLQERFLYVMIDEFQDTNRAQLLLSQYVSDAPVHEGQPNVMVVGDDDQAIFKFQGADIANVANFEDRYSDCATVTLIKNYRSSQPILDASRRISRQIALSLEKQKAITKQLVATVEARGTGVVVNEFDHEAAHYGWLAEQISQLRASGVPGNEIAVLAREREHLDNLLPYLSIHGVPVDYERRENVLEQDHVVTLLNMARLVKCLGEQRLAEANALLPPVLSEPMWAIDTADIWHVAQTAYRENKFWLDIILTQKSGRLGEVADFLVELGNASRRLPAEIILDKLVGITEQGFVSPFKSYFFGDELLAKQPADYLTLLSHLSTLRRHLRKYQADSRAVLTIADLVEFADSYRRADNLRMVDISPHREAGDAVKLMTVHKAKGLEFDHVFVIALENDSWTKTGRSNRFGYSENLKIIKPADNDADDSLRLLFVAMTRARHSLHLCYYLKNEDGKAEQPFGPLLALEIEATKPVVEPPAEALSRQYEQRWLKRHGSLSKTDMHSYLADKLKTYKLSATHLNDFVDIGSGGPLYFLTQDLLRFPSTKPAATSYGTAMHAAMSEAHNLVGQGGKLNPSQVIDKFLEVLAIQPLSAKDREFYETEGPTVLTNYLNKAGASLEAGQKVDVSFADQGVSVGEVQLKGNIDRMDLNQATKTVVISDYKTGSPESKWQLPASADEVKRIKMHRYQNQLLFYKLLVDNGSEWGRRGWRAEVGMLRFLKPNQTGKLVSVELVYDDAAMHEFKKLIQAVWQHVMELNFPDISAYPPSLEGTLKFEDDLRSSKI